MFEKLVSKEIASPKLVEKVEPTSKEFEKTELNENVTLEDTEVTKVDNEVMEEGEPKVIETRIINGVEVNIIQDTTTDGLGNKIEGKFPEFPSAFDTQLAPEDYQASDGKHKRIANDALKEAVTNDSELAKTFTPDQLEQINDGRTPRGYVWHHHEQPGKMQLVETQIHQKISHIGGRAIWGGGTANR